MLLHQLSDFDDLIQVTARELQIDPSLVEKDYWIMHGLWGLQQLGMYERAYAATAALYYQGQPDFGDILGRIKDNFERL